MVPLTTVKGYHRFDGGWCPHARIRCPHAHLRPTFPRKRTVNLAIKSNPNRELLVHNFQ